LLNAFWKDIAAWLATDKPLKEKKVVFLKKAFQTASDSCLF